MESSILKGGPKLATYIPVPLLEDGNVHKNGQCHVPKGNHILILALLVIVGWISYLTIVMKTSPALVKQAEDRQILENIIADLAKQLAGRDTAENDRHDKRGTGLPPPLFKTCPELPQDDIPILALKGQDSQLEPQCLQEILPKLTLYTKENAKTGFDINQNVDNNVDYYSSVGDRGRHHFHQADESLNDVYMMKKGGQSNKIVLMIHDMVYQTDHDINGGADVWQDMKAKILSSEENTAVIVVDWSKGSTVKIDTIHLTKKDAKKPLELKLKAGLRNMLLEDAYAQASQNTGYLGTALAHVLDNMDVENIHCIGHGLGAHACGFTGKSLKKRSAGKKSLDKISALDPSGPLFLANDILKQESNEDLYRLTENDAKIVDVLHTDDKLLGSAAETGNIDFYPGRADSGLFGYSQPGAGPLESHFRALTYYSKTIGNKCEVDHFCVHPVSERVVQCSKLSDLQKITIGYQVDSDGVTNGSYAVGVKTGDPNEVIMECKNTDLHMKTDGIQKTINQVIDTLREFALNPELLTNPEYLIDKTTQIAEAIATTIKDIKDYTDDLSEKYEEYFNQINDMSAAINEEERITLLEANKQLGRIRLTLEEIRTEMKLFAKTTIDHTENIIDTLEDFIANPDKEIIEYLIESVADLLIDSLRKLTEAKQIYAVAARELTDVDSTLKFVTKHFKNALELMKATTSDEKQELEDQIDSMQFDNKIYGTQTIFASMKVLQGFTEATALYVGGSVLGSVSKAADGLATAATIAAPSIIKWIKNSLEEEKKGKQIEEIWKEFQTFEYVVQQAQRGIKDMQSKTQNELDKLNKESESVSSWLEEVKRMETAFDCNEDENGDSNCKKLRMQLERYARKVSYSKPITRAIQQFKNLKKEAEAYLKTLEAKKDKLIR